MASIWRWLHPASLLQPLVLLFMLTLSCAADLCVEGLDPMPHFPLRGDRGLWLELPSHSQPQLWLSYAVWGAPSKACLPCLCFITLPFAQCLLCDALHTWFPSPKPSDAAHSKGPRPCKLPLSSLSPSPSLISNFIPSPTLPFLFFLYRTFPPSSLLPAFNTTVALSS